MKSYVESNFAGRLIFAAGAFTTLAVNPWFSFDPVNLPKLLAISSLSFSLVPFLFTSSNLKILLGNRLVLISLIFISVMAISMLEKGEFYSSQIWGTWGRNTGFVTYLSLTILCISSSLFFSFNNIWTLMRSFNRLSYFVTGYTLIQFMQIDPLPWSEKIMIATLGNINFMSSFLGLASISFFTSIVFKSNSHLEKAFFLSMIGLNLSLIYSTGSIQGLAIFCAGAITSISIYLYLVKKNLLATIIFLMSFVAGFIGFLGTTGTGPLGNLLKQDSVVYRLDYWKAALHMVRDNALFGVGIDRYGDFYREYRDFEAATRTGPQRVSTTAHNIFLDVGTGAGLPAAMILVILFVGALAVGWRALKKVKRQFEIGTAMSLVVGFLVFALISINQIGVGVWGFIFLGVLIGVSSINNLESSDSPFNSNLNKHMSKSDKKKMIKYNYREVTISQWPKSRGSVLLVIVSSLLGLSLSLPPFVSDARVLVHYKSRMYDNLVMDLELLGIANFHREKTIELLIKDGLGRKAIDVAQETVSKDPRNFYALSVLATTSGLPSETRSSSLSQLIRLDPNNLELRSLDTQGKK